MACNRFGQIALSEGVDAIREAVDNLRKTKSQNELEALLEDVSQALGFQYYALIHHDDLRSRRTDRVDLKRYPSAISDRLIREERYRRDPVIRACPFAGGAFLWSDLAKIISLNRNDHESLLIGRQEGLHEGITVPFYRLGDCMGSCTFAGSIDANTAERHIGVAQMIGIFAFQAALRLLHFPANLPAPLRLHPRPRDCIVLAGRGLSNKEIARELALAPRTVDGYLTEARRLFKAHDRTELVVSAVLAGEIQLSELRRQPEHSLGL